MFSRLSDKFDVGCDVKIYGSYIINTDKVK